MQDFLHGCGTIDWSLSHNLKIAQTTHVPCESSHGTFIIDGEQTSHDLGQ